MMATSKSIAAVLGPTLVAVTASETLNLSIWANVSPAVVYLNGSLLFVAGLAIIRAHNVWVPRWPVAITLVGWLALAGGAYRMFLPGAPQGAANAPTYAVIATLFAIGVLLTVMSAREGRGLEPEIPTDTPDSRS